MGGAISGYSETGKRCSETAPMMVRSTDRTVAKIGRSMKKWESFMVRLAPRPGLLRLPMDGA